MTAIALDLRGRGVARTNNVVRNNVTINQLLPERIDSDRQLQMAELEAERYDISFDGDGY